MIMSKTSETANLDKAKSIADKQRPVVEKGYLIQTILGNFKELLSRLHSFSSCFLSELSGERHLFTSCDGCQRKHIIGSRWHCKTCATYDLCTQCYMTDCHDNGHAFERIDRSRGKG